MNIIRNCYNACCKDQHIIACVHPLIYQYDTPDIYCRCCQPVYDPFRMSDCFQELRKHTEVCIQHKGPHKTYSCCSKHNWHQICCFKKFSSFKLTCYKKRQSKRNWHQNDKTTNHKIQCIQHTVPELDTCQCFYVILKSHPFYRRSTDSIPAVQRKPGCIDNRIDNEHQCNNYSRKYKKQGLKKSFSIFG